MEIKYEITFHSEWHCGSGLSAGADLDSLVIKDKNNLPYIPGKTIKGLLREAIETLFFFDKELSNNYCNDFYKAFGYFNTETNEAEKGNVFFFNACLSEEIKLALIESKTQNYLYRSMASTAIDDSGIARSHSLRRIETVIPCRLYGKIIIDTNQQFVDEVLHKAYQYTKRVGLNRNRGLGRCTIKAI